MKPSTQFYVYFDNVDVTSFVTPKFIEVNMTNGVFQTGETVKGTVNNNEFSFRLASPNHKESPRAQPGQGPAVQAQAQARTGLSSRL